MSLRMAMAAALTGWAISVAAADVAVKAPWVRATVTGQTATGAFMELTSKDGAKLVSAASPAAAMVEIHSMTMEEGIMKMRPIQVLDLPAGKTVTLGPGGYHVMLIDLKQQLKKGDTVPLKLWVVGQDGRAETLEIKAEVRELTAGTGQGTHKH